jgi:BirA family biotin operon repressor/biotin-[acetyl-CoA-carboxylase] ligase
MVSLALFDVVKSRLGEDYLSIKWPNDLWFKDKKLAGVLVQNRIIGNQFDFSVVGVGLNVNQKNFYSDAPNPASLIHFSGKEESLPTLLEEILNRLDFYYEKLKTDIHALENIYLRCLYRINKWAEYEGAAGRFTAKITGVDSFGQLLLTDRHGDLRVYGFKEIEYLT